MALHPVSYLVDSYYASVRFPIVIQDRILPNGNFERPDHLDFQGVENQGRPVPTLHRRLEFKDDGTCTVRQGNKGTPRCYRIAGVRLCGYNATDEMLFVHARETLQIDLKSRSSPLILQYVGIAGWSGSGRGGTYGKPYYLVPLAEAIASAAQVKLLPQTSRLSWSGARFSLVSP